MSAPDPGTHLLWLCCAPDLSPQRRAELSAAVAPVADWAGLINRAESHGMAPLLYQHLRSAGIEAPGAAALELRGLTLRHRRSDQIRSAVLIDLLTALEQREITALPLKGAALAYVLYPRPELRPMRDLDVLVDASRAEEAQAVLREFGFNAPAHHHGYMHDHHHLPNATCEREGLTVSIEIHHDALSGDVPESIRTDNLASPVNRFELAGHPTATLGHVDTLRHLAYHTFEPVAETKLISVVDLIGYADKFREDIDWDVLHRRYPRVINVLRCLHYISPLPESLHQQLSPPRVPAPAGVGLGMRPLSQIIHRRKAPAAMFRELFYASDWWLHAYYNVAPEKSLWPTRWVRHPARIGQWLWRRARASWRDRAVS